jgi:hypothetical protein
MDLLCRFEEAHPNDYAFLQEQDFMDLGISAFAGIAQWDAFPEHCRRCENCKRHQSRTLAFESKYF